MTPTTPAYRRHDVAAIAVTCAAPCTPPTGTVALDSSNRIATFSLTPGTSLATGATYTATVTAARSLASGAGAGPRIEKLPDAPNVVYMPAMKFGSTVPITAMMTISASRMAVRKNKVGIDMTQPFNANGWK